MQFAIVSCNIASDGKMADLVQLFIGIGLSEIKAKETVKNANVSSHLKSCIDAVCKKLFHNDEEFLQN